MTTESSPSHPGPSRRQVLARGMAGALALTGLGIGGAGTALARNMLEDPTPGVTEGPYWVEELLNRSDVRYDPATGLIQPGLPLSLSIHVAQLLANGRTAPLPGAVVDIWQCNALGLYSDEAVESTSGEKFLRGLQVTNARGNVKFTTVYPGWYRGRTVHIHMRVRVIDAATASISYNFVTQMFFNDRITDWVYSRVYPYTLRPGRDTRNAADGIFTGASSDGEVASEAGEHLLLSLSANRRRAIGSFHVVIDLSDGGYNNPTGGGVGGGPPPGGGL